jgi:peptidoglycan-N-acetylglucosamine deacetylase
VAVTFDDGPHSLGTPKILDALRKTGAKATFFVCGEQVERYPSLAAEIVAEGHRIELHGYRHRVQLRLTRRQVEIDLERGLAAIEEATGVRATTYRPPLGIFSIPGIGAVRSIGLRPLLWSRWGRDWRRNRRPASIAAALVKEVRGGDVLLLHDADHYSAPDCWRATVAAMPAVLGALEEAELRTATVS